SLKLNELTNLVTKLSERIGVLEDDLQKTKHTYSYVFTKLILRIKKLEATIKTGKARKRARVVISEDEEDDSSKQGRIDEDPNIYFAQDDEVVHDQDTAEARQPKDSTAGITVSTAPISFSTVEPVKKSKKLLEQERQGLEEAIRLQQEVDEEERAQVVRDEEIARQLLALDEERVTTDPKTTKDIDWNDPSVQKYWDLKNKPKSEAQARKNMIVYLKNQSNYKMKYFEGMSYDEIRPIFETHSTAARETHSTADRVVYGRRSKEARKDKGKAIMTKPEPEKKSKKLLEQERLGLEEAIRLQKQVNEEEKAQIARDEEIARQLLALDEERVTTETKTTKDIDWNDPSVQKYWDMKNKPKSEAQARKNMIVYLKNQSNYKMKDFDGMSYDEIRPIFEKIWDSNHNFVPMELEIEKEKKKPAESQEIEIEQIEKDTTGKRKKYLPRKRTRSSTKKQKVELDDEKEDLKCWELRFPNLVPTILIVSTDSYS
ncbi:hypothetical protein Tco_1117121, partial [Tanacetum coccineum]